MNNHNDFSPSPDKRPVIVGMAILAGVVVVGVLLIFRYLDSEQARDLDRWRGQLSVIAEERAATIDDWLNSQSQQLEELADNASLQLYLTQLALRQSGNETEPAQLSYLRNLLIASAERLGYLDREAQQPLIPANRPVIGHSGLALFDHQGKLVVATSGFPGLNPSYQDRISGCLGQRRPCLLNIRLTEDDVPVFGFAVPVTAVQGAADNSSKGVLVGIQRADRKLYSLLQNHGSLKKSSETLLIEKRGEQIVYLSPDRLGTLPTRRQLSLNTPNLAAAIALREPGRFALAANYQGSDVLMISQALQQAPWVLLQTIDAKQALSEGTSRRRYLLTTSLLILFLVTAGLVAAWRHGSSVRAQTLARQLRQYSDYLEQQTRLLHAVTDNIKDLIILMTPDHIMLFGNRALAQLTGIEVNDFRGKGLASVIGPATAERLLEYLRQSATDRHRNYTVELSIAGQQGQFQCLSVPLANPDGEGQADLLVLHDVTELEEAQRQRSDLYRRLVGALMKAVDKHDPYSADHSSRVAQTALAIARQLKLDSALQQTISLAANLANVGKIFIPEEILTKTDRLSAEEQALLQRHVDYALEILSDLPFDGPVLETIAQKQKHLDGSGYPRGLAGEQIILPARILAVANSFVALVSPRAYREGLSEGQAIEHLLSETPQKYDRQVVAALMLVSGQQDDAPAD